MVMLHCSSEESERVVAKRRRDVNRDGSGEELLDDAAKFLLLLTDGLPVDIGEAAGR